MVVLGILWWKFEIGAISLFLFESSSENEEREKGKGLKRGEI